MNVTNTASLPNSTLYERIAFFTSFYSLIFDSSGEGTKQTKSRYFVLKILTQNIYFSDIFEDKILSKFDPYLLNYN